jgi:putative ABC transport system substrate-binding protein
MAARILADGEDISTMPIEYAPEFTKKYNPEIAEALGVEIPDDYVAIVDDEEADEEEASDEEAAEDDATDEAEEETTEE